MERSKTQPAVTEDDDARHRTGKKHKRGEPYVSEDKDMHHAYSEDDEASPQTTPKPVSFADALQGKGKKLEIYTGEGEEDIIDDLDMSDAIQNQRDVVDPETCPIVDLPWEEYRALWQPWRWALILKVLGRSLNFKMVEQRIRQLWSLELGCELIDMAKGFIIARFYSKKDYLTVLEGGPWMVLGSYLTISKWQPNFTPNDSIGSTTLVWVRILDIPIEMFKDRVLMRMRNTIGKAVRVDTTSTDVIRGNFARICVEVDLSKPLIPTVMIWGQIITVEYEGLTRICFKCGHYGHRATYYSPPHEPATASPQSQYGNTASSNVGEPTYAPNNPFGSWMMPAYVRKKQQLAQKRMQHKAPISEANRRYNSNMDMNCPVDQETQPSPAAWCPVGNKKKIGPQTRGRLIQSVPPVQALGRSPDVTRVGEVSKFAVLEQYPEEEAILNNIATLKKKIQSLPGSSNLADFAHEKIFSKPTRGTSGPRSVPAFQGPPHKQSAQYVPLQINQPGRIVIHTATNDDHASSIHQHAILKQPMHGESGHPPINPTEANSTGFVATRPPTNNMGTPNIDHSKDDSALRHPITVDQSKGEVVFGAAQAAGRAEETAMEVN